MNKYALIAFLCALSTSALADGVLSKGKFDVGVAGGWGMTETKETLIVTTPRIRRGFKYKLRQSAPVGGITAGYTMEHNQNTFGLVLGVYKDFYTGRNSGQKQSFAGTTATFTKDLQRKYTLEFAGKIGRNFNADWNMYIKLGGLCSQFTEQYRDGKFDMRKNLKGWGGVAGIGLQKSYESFALGLEYDYHYYERMGSQMNYVVGRTIPGRNRSKMRPQYQQVFLKISKTF